ncbi:hypothetical protein M514_11204 [Trichuris suis]|uniref:Uncharacterized protein n=1 Tax=Trichuris suis TaxID=68888 RepID=A0A085LSG7_9BILA|nr:hypothetical protein M513_11204 [Trichuris suis]KFD67986.1 hypothetical protein M514_11204 [Trichuris suis]
MQGFGAAAYQRCRNSAYKFYLPECKLLIARDSQGGAGRLRVTLERRRFTMADSASDGPKTPKYAEEENKALSLLSQRRKMWKRNQ